MKSVSDIAALTFDNLILRAQVVQGQMRDLQQAFGQIQQQTRAVTVIVKSVWHVGAAYMLHRYHKQHPKAVRWLAASAVIVQMAVVIHNARAVH